MFPFQKKKANENLSNPISPESIDAIVETILSLYQGNGKNMHFFLEERLITLKHLLTTILPELGELRWSIDKDEISRVWNFLYVLHADVTMVGAEFFMHHGTAVGKSKEVMLHPTFMADVLGRKSGRQLPTPRTLTFDRQSPVHVGPTHEVRLTSIKNI